jgi:hypothetical protein
VGKPDLFSVKISRANEGMHQDPYHTMDAYHVSAEADGRLIIG